MTVRAGGHVLTASGWEPEAVVAKPAEKKKPTPKAKAEPKAKTAKTETTETATTPPSAAPDKPKTSRPTEEP